MNLTPPPKKEKYQRLRPGILFLFPPYLTSSLVIQNEEIQMKGKIKVDKNKIMLIKFSLELRRRGASVRLDY